MIFGKKTPTTTTNTKKNNNLFIINPTKCDTIIFKQKFIKVLDGFLWLHKSYIISKKPTKSNLYYFLTEWEIYANREWSSEFTFYYDYSKLFEWDEEGFYKVRGFLFNWVDYSDIFYNQYNNILNKNKIFYIYPQTHEITESKFRPMRTKIYKNYLRISYSFGRYVRFYKSFIKIEFLLHIDNQNRVGPQDITKKFDPLFSSFKFTNQLFIYFLKYNKLTVYKQIQYEFYRFSTNKYKNVFLVNSPYLWVTTTDYFVDIMSGDETSIDFDQPFTNDLFSLYYIYSNKNDKTRFNQIINLEDFKFVDWEYYTEDSGIFELDSNNNNLLLNTLGLLNKFYFIEIYKIIIYLFIK